MSVFTAISGPGHRRGRTNGWRLWLAVLVWAQLLPASAALAAERVALIMGNSSYTEIGALPNAANDARSIGAALVEHGYEVTVLIDLTRADMIDALRDFRVASSEAEIAVVYYAGHGMEIDGENYLIPIDAVIEHELDVPDATVALTSVIRQVSGARSLNMIVLDACRNNPFKTRMVRIGGTRSTSVGLAPVAVDSNNTLVAYAADAGATTPDGPSGSNSPFTSAFIGALEGPPRDVRLFMGAVRDGVQRRIGADARPFVYASLGSEEIVFNPMGDGPAVAPPVAQEIGEAEIAEAQELLRLLNLLGDAAEGQLDGATTAAVSAFQTLNGLAETGSPDAATLAALRAAVRYATAAPLPTSAPAPDRSSRRVDHETCNASTDPQERISSCTAALLLTTLTDEERAWVYAKRGWGLSATGHREEAIADFSAAIKLVPEFAVAYRNRGGVLLMLGESERALADLDEAIRIDPGSPNAFWWRGFINANLARPDAALADWEESIRLGGEGSVRALQSWMQEHGGHYAGTIDGLFGAGTRNGLRACSQDPECFRMK